MENIDSCLTNLKEYYSSTNSIEQKHIVRILQTLADATKNKNMDEVSQHLGGLDNITNLPSREALICDTALLKEDAMLIYLHINQIGAIKDLYGMDVVNKIIQEKSEYLERVMRGDSIKVYHIDMQKLAVLVTKESQFEQAFAILKYTLFDNIDQAVFECEKEHSIVTDYTVGISYGIEHLLHRANVALQEAILAKKKYKIFSTCTDTQDLQRSSLDRLKVYKSALHSGNIIPYFQPIVNASDGKIMKYEALARIKTDDGKILSPYEFLNSAIEDKTFEFFSRQMIQKVFDVYSKSKVHMSINVTYENISSPTMVDYIRNRLEKFGGEGITFEIVETEEIKEYRIVDNFIALIKEYGAKVSIDDFGSGYSNFTNIIKLDIDYIKIDGSLIRQLEEDTKVKSMVSGLIQFAKNIGVETIAEFVSSEGINNVVKEIGADYIQGYYYGEPKSAEEYGII
ncbi:EAL domain-containing protein [Sulfurimonas sp.]|nr:EAL domain-containing protein [Sulfurimonas sp.]